MSTLRILSGMRPTGKLHLGHYTGALENWVYLQNLLADDGSKVYETCFLIADYHILSTSLDTSEAYRNSMEMLLDWLAAGIDPQKSPVFRQSQVKEHAELFLLFSMLITSARLERNPTLKEQVRDLNMESLTYGHLGYPVLQAADILLYKGNVVPVGEDQIPHVEITREIARKFNFHFPHPTIGDVFPEPEPKITKFSRLVGLDGKAKMSKSLGNTVLLSDTPEEVFSKVRNAVTDTLKLRRNDPGRPEVCTVFSYHKRFTAQEELAMIEADCLSGALGCVDCKKRCAASISAELEPLLEKRRYYEKRMGLVEEILLDGERKAKELASHTMQEVRTAMRLG
ncbi:MAG: tryptophan--tRNA ligase [Chlorobium sp.]|uniref:tryptophan--tRNA ligase n=1 Tax=Chlorobium sp. TaxID=1095 RepID=UPI0025BEA429|nr:tryptophan--tRNA ligase [Chlorobium sp.]MCF8217121.1 tryptophan--tRNA ligase [Chlorobium sp.]MCF8271967.1 tryptophan--tRNA ligase [Chlorobium sp.]MCF8288338.1 tryptophan--tRNA ligase [Chlorobium sp.]MCF8291917.1 tryptophan--tRNA ligase [Chlorobium sp.]MCF8386024.1 tryptophan--tRNA ligase [Chlorobium sp.]